MLGWAMSPREVDHCYSLGTILNSEQNIVAVLPTSQGSHWKIEKWMSD